MGHGAIGYDRAILNRVFAIWMTAFVLLAGINMVVAAPPSPGGRELHGVVLILLFFYWLCCLIDTLVRFAGLRQGRTLKAWPVFILLQLMIFVWGADGNLVENVSNLWQHDPYMLVPFGYSLIVYLLTLTLRKRLRLWNTEEQNKVGNNMF